MSEMKKDEIFGFSGYHATQNSKGRPRHVLYMDCEKAKKLSEEILKAIEDSDGRGIKFDLHIGQKTNSNTGMNFDSPFMFVKAKMPAMNNGGGNFPAKAVNATPTESADDISAKIAELKALQSKQIG